MTGLYFKFKSEYCSYTKMKERCLNPDSISFKYCGAKGITVCDRWLGKNGFKNFLKDMGSRPEGFTIDRINNDGNYEPGNCRWATPQEQNWNRRKRTPDSTKERLIYRNKSIVAGKEYINFRVRFCKSFTKLEDAVEFRDKLINLLGEKK